MKKYLDVACGESPHWLVKSLEDPSCFYVGVDPQPLMYGPEGFYWKSKEFMLNDAFRLAAGERVGIPEYIDELAVSSWLIDMPAEERPKFLKEIHCQGGPEKYELDTRIKGFRKQKDGDRILKMGIRDLIYDDNTIVEADRRMFPGIVGTSMDDRAIYNSGFYAWNKIENEIFGRYGQINVEEMLRIPLPFKTKSRLEEALSRVHFVKGRHSELPFKDRSFDYVRGSGYDFPQEAVSEAQRVLKKGRIVPVWINGIDTESAD